MLLPFPESLSTANDDLFSIERSPAQRKSATIRGPTPRMPNWDSPSSTSSSARLRQLTDENQSPFARPSPPPKKQSSNHTYSKFGSSKLSNTKLPAQAGSPKKDKGKGPANATLSSIRVTPSSRKLRSRIPFEWISPNAYIEKPQTNFSESPSVNASLLPLLPQEESQPHSQRQSPKRHRPNLNLFIPNQLNLRSYSASSSSSELGLSDQFSIRSSSSSSNQFANLRHDSDLDNETEILSPTSTVSSSSSHSAVHRTPTPILRPNRFRPIDSTPTHEPRHSKELPFACPSPQPSSSRTPSLRSLRPTPTRAPALPRSRTPSLVIRPARLSSASKTSSAHTSSISSSSDNDASIPHRAETTEHSRPYLSGTSSPTSSSESYSQRNLRKIPNLGWGRTPIESPVLVSLDPNLHCCQSSDIIKAHGTLLSETNSASSIPIPGPAMLITPQRLLSRHGDHSTTSPNLQTQDGQFRKSSFRSRFLTSSTAPLRIIKKKASQSFVSSSITGKRIVSGLIGSIGTGKVTKGDHFDPVRAFKRQISYPVLNQSSQLHESEDEEDDKEEESSIKGLVNTLKCIGGTTPVASSSLFIMNEDEQAKRRLRTEIPWSTHVSSPVGSPHGSSPAFALSSPENGRQRLKPKISFTRLLKPKQSPEGLRATSPRALSGIISRKSSLSQLFRTQSLAIEKVGSNFDDSGWTDLLLNQRVPSLRSKRSFEEHAMEVIQTDARAPVGMRESATLSGMNDLLLVGHSETKSYDNGSSKSHSVDLSNENLLPSLANEKTAAQSDGGNSFREKRKFFERSNESSSGLFSSSLSASRMSRPSSIHSSSASPTTVCSLKLSSLFQSPPAIDRHAGSSISDKFSCRKIPLELASRLEGQSSVVKALVNKFECQSEVNLCQSARSTDLSSISVMSNSSGGSKKRKRWRDIFDGSGKKNDCGDGVDGGADPSLRSVRLSSDRLGSALRQKRQRLEKIFLNGSSTRGSPRSSRSSRIGSVESLEVRKEKFKENLRLSCYSLRSEGGRTRSTISSNRHSRARHSRLGFIGESADSNSDEHDDMASRFGDCKPKVNETGIQHKIDELEGQRESEMYTGRIRGTSDVAILSSLRPERWSSWSSEAQTAPVILQPYSLKAGTTSEGAPLGLTLVKLPFPSFEDDFEFKKPVENSASMSDRGGFGRCVAENTIEEEVEEKEENNNVRSSAAEPQVMGEIIATEDDVSGLITSENSKTRSSWFLKSRVFDDLEPSVKEIEGAFEEGTSEADDCFEKGAMMMDSSETDIMEDSPTTGRRARWTSRKFSKQPQEMFGPINLNVECFKESNSKYSPMSISRQSLCADGSCLENQISPPNSSSHGTDATQSDDLRQLCLSVKRCSGLGNRMFDSSIRSLDSTSPDCIRSLKFCDDGSCSRKFAHSSTVIEDRAQHKPDSLSKSLSKMTEHSSPDFVGFHRLSRVLANPVHTSQTSQSRNLSMEKKHVKYLRSVEGCIFFDPEESNDECDGDFDALVELEISRLERVQLEWRRLCEEIGIELKRSRQKWPDNERSIKILQELVSPTTFDAIEDFITNSRKLYQLKGEFGAVPCHSVYKGSSDLGDYSDFQITPSPKHPFGSKPATPIVFSATHLESHKRPKEKCPESRIEVFEDKCHSFTTPPNSIAQVNKGFGARTFPALVTLPLPSAFVSPEKFTSSVSREIKGEKQSSRLSNASLKNWRTSNPHIAASRSGPVRIENGGRLAPFKRSRLISENSDKSASGIRSRTNSSARKVLSDLSVNQPSPSATIITNIDRKNVGLAVRKSTANMIQAGSLEDVLSDKLKTPRETKKPWLKNSGGIKIVSEKPSWDVTFMMESASAGRVGHYNLGGEEQEEVGEKSLEETGILIGAGEGSFGYLKGFSKAESIRRKKQTRSNIKACKSFDERNRRNKDSAIDKSEMGKQTGSVRSMRSSTLNPNSRRFPLGAKTTSRNEETLNKSMITRIL